MLGRELGGKRLELLKEAVPRVTRIMALYEPGPLGVSALEVRDLHTAARALKLIIQTSEVRDTEGFEKVFAAISKARPDGLYVVGSTLMFANRKRTTDFALMTRLPSMYNNREFVDDGGLMSYGADLAESYRRVAYFIDRILKGAKPADLPVEQPTKFEFVINLKTAKRIGLTIPPEVLARATKLIK
jgi:putative ABC transport system substrate-binding protein